MMRPPGSPPVIQVRARPGAGGRLAVLDLGLDSFHLAVFESGRSSAPLLCRRTWSETVRTVDPATARRLSEEGAARGLAAAGELLRNLEAFDPVCPVLAFASSALGQIENGPAFCAEVERHHGVAVELMSGEREARLGYLGARSELARPGHLAVVDAGGLSLGLATGTGSDPDLAFSLPVGVDLLHEVHHLPGH